MLYHTEFPESMISSHFVPGWNLGDVYITDGFAKLIEDMPQNSELLNDLLTSQFLGDYGLISSDAKDLQRANEARKAGRSFTGAFNVGDECIKVVTHPNRKRTVVCLLRED